MWGKAEGDPYNSDEQPQESKPTRLRARLGASLAKLTHSPELLMTDSESYRVAEPVPLVSLIRRWP